MACYWPLPATPNPRGGKPLVHSPLNYVAKPGDIKLPCGRCTGCRITWAQNWAVRCLHESQLQNKNGFLTLTYRPTSYTASGEPVSPTLRVDEPEIPLRLTTIAPEGLKEPNIAHVDNLREKLRPEGGDTVGLSKIDHQKFIKRYRDKCGPLRFFMCGEYGDKLLRPHYHYLIFGHRFDDRYYWKTSLSGERLYRSATLEKLWPFGHAWIGDVTYESCAYVAAYVHKKMSGPKADWHYRRTDEAGNDYWLMPEFNLMSRGGRYGRGIAAEWFDEFNQDVYVEDHVVRRQGKAKPPRYYDKLLKLMDPSHWELIKHTRQLRAKELDADNTPQRLAAKEAVTKAKMALKQRQLEQI